jgi:hypothetical protein
MGAMRFEKCTLTNNRARLKECDTGATGSRSYPFAARDSVSGGFSFLHDRIITAPIALRVYRVTVSPISTEEAITFQLTTLRLGI